jgi:TolA-binding protein
MDGQGAPPPVWVFHSDAIPFMSFLSNSLPLSPAASAAIVFAIGTPALVAPARAQAPVGLDMQDTQQGLKLLGEGKYEEASKLFEGVPQKYPTSPLIPEATFRLGYSLYMLGDHDRGVDALRKVLELKNVPPELSELSYSFIPQVLAAKAAKLQANDTGRKEAFLAAIKEFDAFIAKYPASEEVESANYGKARAYYSVEMFEEAIQALRTNVQKFPQSQSALDTKFMLAVALGTKGTIGIAKGNAADPELAKAFDDGGRLLGEIILQRGDMALSNNAQFQLAEMQAARGMYETGDRKKQLLQYALDAYRAVLPKETVIKLQKDRVAAIQAVITKGGMAPDQFKRLQRFLEKEREKSVALEEQADQTLACRLKAAQIFVALEQFDASRVVLRFIEPQVEDPEQKKQVAYYLALTYAAQQLTDKAVPAYEKFMAEYKGDPIAENLPMILGAAFTAQNQPEKAAKYFREQAQIYPKSKLSSDAALNEALSLIPLERYADALAVLKKYLASNPPAEQARAASLGVATIYQKTNKPEEALKTYTEVREKFPGTTEGGQAAFWVSQLALVKNDAPGALVAAQLFLKNYPTSELQPSGLLVLGQAQSATGDKAGALQTFREIGDKHPKSEAAPVSYFQQAAILQQESQLPQVKEVMKKFIASYPDSDRLFAAYDYVAQIQVAERAMADAVATYSEYLEKRPKEADAAKALVKASEHSKKLADDLGVYLSLNEAQREQWNKYMTNSVSFSEKVVENFPDAPEVSRALQTLLACQKFMQRVKLKSEQDVDAYFQGFAQKFEKLPATRSKVLFAYAGLLSEKNEPKSFEVMKSAYDAKLLYAPADLDLYGGLLLKRKAWADAQKVFEKLAKDYPLPPNTPPAKAPRTIGDAQSTAVYGLAKVLQGQDKKAEAAKKFEELKANYPYSSKLLEAEFGIAENEVQSNNLEEAVKRLALVAKSTTAATNLRARAMLLIGDISLQQGDLDSAINNYIKVGTLFPAESELAPEALWRGAQQIERKMNGAVSVSKSSTPAPAPAKPGAKK